MRVVESGRSCVERVRLARMRRWAGVQRRLVLCVGVVVSGGLRCGENAGACG